MKIPEQYFKMIIDEFKEIQKLCNNAKTTEDKLYFFSAAYGILNRVLNFYCEPILVFMHDILFDIHRKFSDRLRLNKPGNIHNSFPIEMIEALFSYYSMLIKEFENKDENKIREILEKFSNLSYATSGNGFYLYIRGKLVI